LLIRRHPADVNMPDHMRMKFVDFASEVFFEGLLVHGNPARHRSLPCQIACDDDFTSPTMRQRVVRQGDAFVTAFAARVTTLRGEEGAKNNRPRSNKAG